jgi:ribonucleotide reductase beta subunit family protein with ferritin-like domain
MVGNKICIKERVNNKKELEKIQARSKKAKELVDEFKKKMLEAELDNSFYVSVITDGVSYGTGYGTTRDFAAMCKYMDADITRMIIVDPRG